MENQNVGLVYRCIKLNVPTWYLWQKNHQKMSCKKKSRQSVFHFTLYRVKSEYVFIFLTCMVKVININLSKKWFFKNFSLILHLVSPKISYDLLSSRCCRQIDQTRMKTFGTDETRIQDPTFRGYLFYR